MKFKADDVEFFELSELHRKVIANDIPQEILDDDIKRRMKYIIEHKYEQCMKRLKDEWIPRLKEKGLTSVPLNDDELATLIFNQNDYKDRSARESLSES